MTDLDFKGLAASLLSRAHELVPQWLPGGKFTGHEYECGSIRGGSGDSMKVSMKTGNWKDFAVASGCQGGDLISLYSEINGLKNGQAFHELAKLVGLPTAPAPIKSSEIEIGIPPENAAPPDGVHYKYGSPSKMWRYNDPTGKHLFYVGRYDTSEGKQCVPWSWSPNKVGWTGKGFPKPRPLYGLDLLAQNPDKPVMIVEGEKACDSARSFAGNVYVVVTWPNGATAMKQSDWTPLNDRKILIWPDADKPGIEAAQEICKILGDQCPEIKIVDTTGLPDKWDAADSTFTWATFAEWAKPRIKLFVKPITPEILKPTAKHPKPKVEINVNVSHDDGEISESMTGLVERLGLSTNKNGGPHYNESNVLKVMSGVDYFKDMFWYDEFHTKIFTKWNGPLREWGDIDTTNLLIYFQHNYGFIRLTEGTLKHSILARAHMNKRNELQEWLGSLKWDGKSRVEEFLSECYGVKPSEYVYKASKNWWIGLAARALNPGCQVDTMIILEGAQGTFKSSSLRLIGGPWYTEAHGSVMDKDFYMALQGKLIVEIAELDSFSKAEVSTIKKIITCTKDRYRPPFGVSTLDFPRQCVFVGTTNEHEYLRDSTGARRFWPITAGKIDLEKIKRDREQLFAEAVARFKNNETWYEMPKEDTEEQQEFRREKDEWEPLAEEYYYKNTANGITILGFADRILDLKASQVDRKVCLRISKVFRKIGLYGENERLDIGGVSKVRNIYRHPDYPRKD